MQTAHHSRNYSSDNSNQCFSVLLLKVALERNMITGSIFVLKNCIPPTYCIQFSNMNNTDMSL